jgi:hypothetical protein
MGIGIAAVAGKGAAVADATLPAAGWTNSSNSQLGTARACTVEIPEVQAGSTIIAVQADTASVQAAVSAGLNSYLAATDGQITAYAKTTPAAAISLRLLITG